MANRTVKDARTVKGTNPQYLIEKIIRTRIYESKYWKEECFALSGMYCGNGTTVACQKSPPPTELQIPATVTILVVHEPTIEFAAPMGGDTRLR